MVPFTIVLGHIDIVIISQFIVPKWEIQFHKPRPMKQRTGLTVHTIGRQQ